MFPQEWTPYGIFGFRRRWRPNWRFLMWSAINVLAWVAVIYGLAWWL